MKVIDENNHAPTFGHSSYWTTAEGRVPSGASVMRVTADDSDNGLNARVTYSMTSPYFLIDSVDGTVRAKKQLRKRSEVYEATARATDQGKPSRSSDVQLFLSVHTVHDRPPNFQNSSYHVKVAEDMSKGSTLVNVAVSNAFSAFIKNVKFSIVGGDLKKQFTIDTKTGAVSLKKTLDYEEVKFYKLIIRATQTHLNPKVPDLTSEVISRT
mgnify:CR=1 FL=1